MKGSLFASCSGRCYKRCSLVTNSLSRMDSNGRTFGSLVAKKKKKLLSITNHPFNKPRRVLFVVRHYHRVPPPLTSTMIA